MLSEDRGKEKKNTRWLVDTNHLAVLYFGAEMGSNDFLRKSSENAKLSKNSFGNGAAAMRLFQDMPVSSL